MCSGGGKSGSPAPKPITSRPSALRALAVASTASVADGAMLAMRAEMRDMPRCFHVARPEDIRRGAGAPGAATGRDFRAARVWPEGCHHVHWQLGVHGPL